MRLTRLSTSEALVERHRADLSKEPVSIGSGPSFGPWRMAKRLFGLFLLLPTAAAWSEDGPSVAAVAEQLLARDRGIRTYACELQIEARTQSEQTGQIVDYAIVERIEVDRESDRFMVHRVGQLPQPPAPHLGKSTDWLQQRTETVAFDGESTNVMTKMPGLEPGSGTSTSIILRRGTVIKGRQGHWTFDPGELIGTSGGYPIGDLLLQDHFQASSESSGLVMLSCEHSPAGTDASDRRGRSRYWVDPAKGYAIARFEFALWRGSLDGWVTYWTGQVEDWEQLDSTWLPRVYHREFWALGEGATNRLMDDMRITVSNWSLNRPIPDDHFRVAFEPGTTVNDTDRGTVYLAAQITNATIARDAAVAKELQGRLESAEGAANTAPLPRLVTSQYGRILLVSLAVVTASGLVAWLLIRKRRGSQ